MHVSKKKNKDSNVRISKQNLQRWKFQGTLSLKSKLVIHFISIPTPMNECHMSL